MTAITFFFAVLVAGFALKQKYMARTVSMETVRTGKIPTEKEPIRAHGFA